MAHVALVTTLLGRTDLFRSLNEADRSAVAAQMREATYEADQLIFSRGDPGDAVHLVVEGQSASPFSQLKAKYFRFGTLAEAILSARLPRSMARREVPMPRRSRKLPR